MSTTCACSIWCWAPHAFVNGSIRHPFTFISSGSSFKETCHSRKAWKRHLSSTPARSNASNVQTSNSKNKPTFTSFQISWWSLSWFGTKKLRRELEMKLWYQTTSTWENTWALSLRLTKSSLNTSCSRWSPATEKPWLTQNAQSLYLPKKTAGSNLIGCLASNWKNHSTRHTSHFTN